jgi:hypothetical protein
MASFEQDLIIFEDDSLILRYTFTDLEDPFTTSYAGWWGAYPYATFPPSTPTSPTIQKYGGWQSDTPDGVPTGTNGLTIPSGDSIINISFSQDDFVASAGTLATDTEYYTELVLSTNGFDTTSIVAATGKLFISSSMFSIAGYRPS